MIYEAKSKNSSVSKKEILMNTAEDEKKAKKEAMKKLRADRNEQIAAASERMKKHNKNIEAIIEQMKNDVGTVPRIAEATGIPSSDVLWYIAALKKYGKIIEAEKDGNYFQYALCREEVNMEDGHDIG
jgi:hypothetical protein